MKVNEKWRTIWNDRGLKQIDYAGYSKRDLLLKLKELNGFDVVDGGLLYKSFMEQYLRTKGELMYDSESMTCKRIESLYEVGCGSGANLFLFACDGISVGGIDYSKNLVEVARYVLEHCDFWNERDYGTSLSPNLPYGRQGGGVQCDEAINLPLEIKYDCVLSNSVFSYFPDFEYAEKVLNKMLKICKRNIAILDIHYDKRKDDFIEYRRKIVTDYDERYKELDKLFYSKDFFIDFAERNDLDIKFTNSTMYNYWNNEFIFNCFMYNR